MGCSYLARAGLCSGVDDAGGWADGARLSAGEGAGEGAGESAPMEPRRLERRLARVGESAAAAFVGVFGGDRFRTTTMVASASAATAAVVTPTEVAYVGLAKGSQCRYGFENRYAWVYANRLERVVSCGGISGRLVQKEDAGMHSAASEFERSASMWVFGLFVSVLGSFWVLFGFLGLDDSRN